MTCTAFRAYKDASEVGVAGMEADKRGMKSPVVSAHHAGIQFFMECDVKDIPVHTHERTVAVFYLVFRDSSPSLIFQMAEITEFSDGKVFERDKKKGTGA